MRSGRERWGGGRRETEDREGVEGDLPVAEDTGMRTEVEGDGFRGMQWKVEQRMSAVGAQRREPL